MSRGNRTTQLDLTTDTDRNKLVSLIEESDVFLQNYRPGGIAEKGFGAIDLAKIRPGIVSANLTAWGWEGPWRDRRGVRIASLVRAVLILLCIRAVRFSRPNCLWIQC